MVSNLSSTSITHGSSVQREATRVAQVYEQGYRTVQERKEAASQQDDTQSDKMLQLIEDIQLFKTPGGDFYAQIPVNGHREVWSIKSSKLKHWLLLKYKETYGQIPNPTTVAGVLETLEGMADFSQETQEVFLRVGCEKKGKDVVAVYLDLCNDDWKVVKVTRDGWKVLDESPVMFRRVNGMHAIPTPVKGGKLDDLKGVLNYGRGEEGAENWTLLVGWLLGLLMPKGAYPTLILQGEQGSAKTSTIRYLRGLVDPNEAPTYKQPKDSGDMHIKAQNTWVFALDNLSRMPQWLSDQICGLNTGSGDGARMLYSDDQMKVFSAKRPCSINGIEDLATAGDLADRSVIASLPTIPKSGRRSEADLDAKYEEMRPRVLGALLDAVSCALRNQGQVHLEDLPRMADFALWVTAAEESLGWEPKTFIEAYYKNKGSNTSIVVDSSPVASAIVEMLKKQPEWKGNATELYEKLKDYRPDSGLGGRGRWPTNGAKLGSEVRRIAPSLRDLGYTVEHMEHGKRLITLKSLEHKAVEGSSTAAEGSKKAVTPGGTALASRGSAGGSGTSEVDEGSRGSKIPTSFPISSEKKEDIKKEIGNLPPVPPDTAQSAQEAARGQGSNAISTADVPLSEAVPPDSEDDYDLFLDTNDL